MSESKLFLGEIVPYSQMLKKGKIKHNLVFQTARFQKKGDGEGLEVELICMKYFPEKV